MTLNDLERHNSPYFAFFHQIRQIFRPIISQWSKIDLYMYMYFVYIMCVKFDDQCSLYVVLVTWHWSKFVE